MLEGLELAKLPWGDIGAGTLVVLTVLLIFSGRLIPRGTYRDVVEQRDTFKQAWQESQSLLRDMDGRMDANTEALRAVEAALTEVVKRGGRRP